MMILRKRERFRKWMMMNVETCLLLAICTKWYERTMSYQQSYVDVNISILDFRGPKLCHIILKRKYIR